ncbi:MAG: extracellular solute-binding protein [Patescibacteria group bacterium]
MKKILILSILAALTMSGALCKTTSKEITEATKPVQLVYWRVFDDSDAFTDLIAEYNKVHPNVNITYRKLRYDEFEKKLLEAMAEDRGPDIFSIHNTWVRGYQSKLLSLPESISLPYRTIQGTIKKDVVWEMQNKKSLSLRDLKTQFIDQVYDDVVLPEANEKGTANKIYGLPLSVDTLVLFYNKELLNAAGIPEPAKDWQTLQEQVKKLTKQNTEGDIITSGIAMGAANNVDRAMDILSVLMMQNGTKMANDGGAATFNVLPEELQGRTSPPGIEALTFYTDFASPQKEVYSWNETMPNSLDAFIQGKAAYMLSYSYNLPIIRARAPKLNFGVAKIPQISGNKEINYANYWVETVSKKTIHPNEAWDFIQFIANTQNVEKYLTKTKKPTALRSLVQKQSEDIDLYPFVSQLLTAKSWYKGKNATAAEDAMKQMITEVIRGTYTIPEAINLGVQKVNQTL